MAGTDSTLAPPAFFSVQPLCPLCLCGDLPCNHRDTEDTEVAQRRTFICHCLLLLSPRTVTLTPLCNLSNPSIATTSPAFNPSTAVTFPSVVPVVTVCIATV